MHIPDKHGDDWHGASFGGQVKWARVRCLYTFAPPVHQGPAPQQGGHDVRGTLDAGRPQHVDAVQVHAGVYALLDTWISRHVTVKEWKVVEWYVHIGV